MKQGGVLSPTLFSIYIDKLLLKLKESGYGCHLNGIYMGALAYADDITITCPSRRGLHKMLVLCNNFGNENYIIFNTKKTLCVKYGEPVNDHEYIYFNKIKLDWYDKVRHLGNFFSCNINDSTDITHKRSNCIGYFNKLMSHFAFIQPAILNNLFKTYCCSYYGSIIWHYNSHGFDKYCIQWNKSMRKIFSLSNTAHRWLLGPLMGQYHIKYQLYMKDIKLLYNMNMFVNNTIEQECLHNAMYNANTVIGYKLAFFRENFNINLFENDINYCLRQVHPATLDMEDQSLVDCLHTQIMAKSDEVTVDGFEMEELDFIINSIACH